MVVHQESKSVTVLLTMLISILLHHMQCYPTDVYSANTYVDNIIRSCSCSGYIVAYECTVMGNHSGVTVWGGNAFNCPLNEIVLQHREFPDANGVCMRSDGTSSIKGRALRVDNDTMSYYTSQISVTLSSDLAGTSIECSYDASDGTGAKPVQVWNISSNLTSDLFVPLGINNWIPNIPSNSIMFVWSPVTIAFDCPAIHYNISASNCGSCPTTTNYTNATCTDVPTDGSECIFAVKTIVNGNTCDDFSDEINLIMNFTHNINTLESPASSLTVIILAVTVALFANIGIVIGVSSLLLIIKRRISNQSSSGMRISRNVNHDKMDDISQVSHGFESTDYTTLKIVDNQSIGIYGLDDTYNEEMQAKMSSPVNKESDKDQLPLDLNNLLQQLRGQANPQWYSFGLVFGIPQDILDRLKEYPESQRLIEVLDYWLRHHHGQPTWQEFAEAQDNVKKQHNSSSCACTPLK